MLSVFDKYMMKNIAVAMTFVALSLSAIIFLTQSLKFLELIIESGASGGAFWHLTMLALPRFFEVILPLALLAGVSFIYARMISDSEIVVLRGSGLSALNLSRPAIIMAIIVTLILMSITMWVGPKSLSKMQGMRQVIKSQFSMLFFKEGVFNQIGSGLTVYIREKASNGELHGIVINDSRDRSKEPSTVIARRGTLVANDDGFQVLVYEGARQSYDRQSRVLNRLNFERYTIDLPNTEEVSQRWAEPDERTIFELLDPDFNNSKDVKSLREFRLEVHKRVISPFLALSFTLIGCSCLLLGSYSRRGQAKRIALIALPVVFIQGAYLSAFSIAQDHYIGLIFMYVLVFAPIIFCFFMMSRLSENFRRHILYGARA